MYFTARLPRNRAAFSRAFGSSEMINSCRFSINSEVASMELFLIGVEGRLRGTWAEICRAFPQYTFTSKSTGAWEMLTRKECGSDVETLAEVALDGDLPSVQDKEACSGAIEF